MTRMLTIALVFLPAILAQNISLRDNRDHKLDCSRAPHCEMREETVSSTGDFVISGIHNGEVTVRGWTRSDVQVRYRVKVDGFSDREARDLMGRIKTRTSPGRITIDGPDRVGGLFSWMWESTWEVSAEVLLPQKTNLRVETHNGRIFVSDLNGRAEVRSHNGPTVVERVTGDVRAASHNGSVNATDVGGSVDFESHNGATVLTRVGGNVRGTNHNGRAEVELMGSSSASRRVDVENHNGAITVAMPRSFSARVRTESHHGSLNSDFPTPAKRRDRDDDTRDFSIGSGDASIRLRTHNGSIRLRST